MKRAHEYAELDLFSELDENKHVEKVQWNEIKTSTNLGNDVQSLHFTIPKATERKMIDLMRTQLMVDVSLVKKTGTTTAAAPVNNFLHSMFENCIIKFNDDVVYDSNKNYHYTSFLLDLLDRSKEQHDGQMTAQLWYKDTPRQHIESCSADNLGWKARNERNKLGNIPMIGRLHSDIFNQERYFINDVTISVELTLAKPTFSIMADDTGTDKHTVKIKDAKLYVPYVQLADKTMEEINTTLKTKPMIYPIQRTHTKTIPIDIKGTTVTIDDISRGRLPKRIVMGFVTDKAKAGDYKKNPFNFQGNYNSVYNITSMELNVDGMPYAKRALTPDFTADDFGKTYFNLYDSLNYLHDGTSAPVISFEDYPFGYCLFPFNLNPGCSSEAGVFKSEGVVSLDIGFKTAPTETLQLVVMCVYDNEIRIDKDRKFTKDW